MSLKLVRRPKSPYWVIRGTIRGVRYDESSGTRDKRIAEELRVKRESEINKEHIYGRSSTATFAHAAESYLENGGSRNYMEPIIKHFGLMPLAKIDQAAIEAGCLAVYPGRSPATRNRQFFTPVSAVLNHGAKLGLCSKPIMVRPKLKPGIVRWITLDKANKLIDACAPHLKPLVVFLLYTGARAGEALWLDWHNVDLQRRHVTFPKTKTKKPRGVPLNQRVVIALANLKHRDAEVFRRPDGEAYTRPRHIDDHSAGTRIKTAFKAACRRAGIANFRVHDLRHTWATWHYQQNRDLTALMALGGWSTVSTVMRYAHANADEHRHTIDRLPAGRTLGDTVTAREKTA
jgi:integrase